MLSSILLNLPLIIVALFGLLGSIVIISSEKDHKKNSPSTHKHKHAVK